MLLAIEVHTANEHDSKSGARVLEQLKYSFERMRKIYADGSCRGKLVNKVKNELGYDMEITVSAAQNMIYLAFIALMFKWL